MRAKEFILEGGWASTATQNTHITPALVAKAVANLSAFETNFNKFLHLKDIPPCKMGKPCGSTTYYLRDLKSDPTREYGDIDVHFFIPRIASLSNNANATVIRDAVIEFCQSNPNYETGNGTNVIFNIDNDYVQVDLVTAFYENEQWADALAPEYRVKGVLTASLTSSLAEALNLSFGVYGVQAKLINNSPVSFKLSKGTTLKTITTNPKTWALDIAKFFGATNISPLLQQFPGLVNEVRTQDIINSIKGIAQSLETSGILGSKGITDSSADALCNRIIQIYAGKVDAAINSPKYDKAETPGAIQKAKDTKEMLARESQRIIKQFGI